MADPQAWVATTCTGLADVLSARSPTAWDAASLCEGWRVRHVVAHLTMPVRLTPEQFGRELAAAGGDFGVLSDAVAVRDGALGDGLLDSLRSPALHAWQPPGGGPAGAVSHAVIHALDVTLALELPPVAPPDAVRSVLEQLATRGGNAFGLDLTDRRFEATDDGWSWGSGEPVRADSAALVALLSGRTLPDGRTLRGD